jgi:hypothetical protein
MAEEDRMGVLGLYEWKIWQRIRFILGESLENNY